MTYNFNLMNSVYRQ